MLFTSRLLGVVASVAIVAAMILGLRLAEARALAGSVIPAQAALVQSVDLSRIDRFRYVDDRTLNVVDGSGRHFKMEFTEDCPGLKRARDISLVTESYRDLDRFTAIAVEGHLCTFKDFAPRP